MAQEKDTLSAFIEKNPNAVDFNIIYEGTKLNLSADDDFLLVNVSVAHPALQMRFLMQNLSLYIDPSGKKRKKYEVKLPSAFDVKDEIEAAIPRGDADREENARPDIRPLISALNRRGADVRHDGQNYHLGFQYFHIEHDRKNDVLNFYILLPKEMLLQDRKLAEKWTLGLFSINDFSNMPPPEQEGDGGMIPPPIEGGNQQTIQELMQSDIKEWVKFSIDDVNNANLTNDVTSSLIKVEAVELKDSVDIRVTAYKIETQLAFLMQGLNICVEQPDTLILSFPSASMVRNKVRRHPNEVKAELASQKRHLEAGHDSVNNVVRPDVQPLVAALNDTTATIVYGNIKTPTQRFRIEVDREQAIMIFSFKVKANWLTLVNGILDLDIYSLPMKGDRQEFVGHRLSGEKSPQPHGLGEGLRKEDAANRTFREKILVKIQK